MRKFHSTDPTTAAYNAIVSFILLFGVLDMFTKVVVGLVAAIAVAGAGVYYAQSDSSGCKGGCPIQRMLDSGASTETTECPSCCKPASASTEAPTDESLAAFTGSAVLKQNCESPAPKCCVE